MPHTPIEAFIHLVQNTAESLKNHPQRAHAGMVDDLDRFSRERLIPLWQREQKSSQNPYVLSFVGLTNVGKSTLMEALLGFPVAPRKATLTDRRRSVQRGERALYAPPFAGLYHGALTTTSRPPPGDWRFLSPIVSG